MPDGNAVTCPRCGVNFIMFGHEPRVVTGGGAETAPPAQEGLPGTQPLTDSQIHSILGEDELASLDLADLERLQREIAQAEQQKAETQQNEEPPQG